MHKKAFLACMLVVTMLLTGCTLIEKDEAVDRATEVVRVSNSAGGEDIVYTKGEVLDEVNYQLNYMSYLYSMLGYSYDPTDPTIIAKTKDDVMDMLVEDAVETLKAQELGLNEFTEEELAEIAESVDNDWESNKSSLQSQEFADTELTGDELDAALEARMAEMGYTREQLEASYKHTKMLDKLREETIKDVVVTEEELQADYDEKVASQQETYDATPTSYVSALNNGSTVYYAPAGVRLVKQILLQFSEEDQEIIDTLQDLISDKTTEVSTLTTSLNNAISALGTETTLTADDLAAQVSVAMESPKAVEPTAAPEAEETTDAEAAEDAEADTEAAPVTTVTDRPVSTLATVSDLTANFTEEIDESLQEMAKELATAQAEKAFFETQLNNAKENGWKHLNAKAEEILAKIDAGEDFDALIDEYNEDPGMAADSTARKNGGYAVCEGYTSFDADFLAAALALENVGDVSGQVRTQFGTHILLYAADVQQGPVGLDAVRDGLEASLLATKQDETYAAQVETWTQEAKVTTNRNALDN